MLELQPKSGQLTTTPGSTKRDTLSLVLDSKLVIAIASIFGTVGIYGLLGQSGLLRPHLSQSALLVPSGKLSNAVWYGQATEGTQRPVPKVNVDVPLGSTQPADRAALQEALKGGLPLPGNLHANPLDNPENPGAVVADVAANPSMNGASPSNLRATSSKSATIRDADILPEWFVWARMGCRRAEVRVTEVQNKTTPSPELPTGALGVYATRNDNGVTLCMVNRTTAKIQTSAGFQLSRGVYRIERLRYTRPVESARAESAKNTSAPASDTSISDTSISDTSISDTSIARYRTNCAPFIMSSFGGRWARPDGNQNRDEKWNDQAEIVERLESMEGSDIGGITTVRKPLLLEPGEVCFYRCTDVSRIARAAWYESFDRLRDMSHTTPGPMRRLGAMLHEAEGDLNSLRGGRPGEGVSGRVSDIHHLLLHVAQAHSLHKNYQLRHVVNEAQGKGVMNAFENLADSLSETSAVLLGLVPQITVTSVPAPVALVLTQNSAGSDLGTRYRGNELNRAHQKRPQNGDQNINSSDQNINQKEKRRVALNSNGYRKIEPNSTERTVTIALANTGGRSVENVKLGLDLSKLPAEVICDPVDPAYFGTLRPGQTVRATYHLRGNALNETPNALLIGDVSYFAGTAPAHLRPRAR